jgi:hypothetical protein
LTLTKAGSYSGRLYVAGTNRVFAGAFSPRNQAAFPLPGVSVQLGLDPVSVVVTGQVASAAWTSELWGVRAAGAGARRFAGRYTKLVGSGPDPAANPAGLGPLAVTVTTNGLLQCLGTLADGSPVSQSASLSAAGEWPFFASLYGGRGLAIGWFDLDPATPQPQPALWIKPPLRGNYYPGGFSLTTEASLWSCPAPGQPLFNWPQAQGVISFEGGNLPGVLTSPVAVNGTTLVVQPGGQVNSLTLSVSPASGLFSGSFRHPATGKITPFSGAWDRAAVSAPLQGAGWFAGANQCGRVWIAPL